MGKLVNKKEFADILGKSPRHISELIANHPDFPIEDGGGRGVALKIDTAKAIEWLIQTEVNKQLGHCEIVEGSLASEELKLKRARREKVEMETATARKELLPFPVVEQILLRVANIFSTQLQVLPPRNANALAIIDNPAEVEDKLQHECARIQSATAGELLSEVQTLTAEINGSRESDGQDGGPTATENSGRMGA
ncbi:terminase small subunit [Spartinivicinus ruber]|uniref:terminase small subunit n=1 Tax=Spartinivicinus ruber TaxID=2683272 RepID=UPI0013D4C8DF|nr:terminase small subunit [Spartinivicinus ruber]